MENTDKNLNLQDDSQPFPFLFIEPEPEPPIRARSLDLMEKVASISGRMHPTGKRDKILVVNSIGTRDVHAEEIVAELACRGAPVFFLDGSTLAHTCRLSIRLDKPDQPAGFLELPSGELALDEIRSVWFRGPGFVPGDIPGQMGGSAGFVNRETEAAFLGLCGVLEHSFWVNHPNAVYTAQDKLAQLKMAQSLGLLIPRTLVTNHPQKARDFFESCGGEMIIKTFRRLAFDRDGEEFFILTNRVQRTHLNQLERVRHAPCLFQEYVPKEFELRVTVIGRRVFAAEIHSQRSPISREDYRRYDLDNTPYYPHALPHAIETACLGMLDRYGLSFAAMDMIRRPDGAYVFLEINANAQFLWIQDLTGMPLRETLADLLIRGRDDE